MSDTFTFPHERLEAYRYALKFYAAVLDLSCPQLRKGQTRYDQLVDASESILRNIGEGASSVSSGTKSRFYRIALGSAGECAACLDVIRFRFPALADRAVAARVDLETTARLTAGLVRRQDRGV